MDELEKKRQAKWEDLFRVVVERLQKEYDDWLGEFQRDLLYTGDTGDHSGELGHVMTAEGEYVLNGDSDNCGIEDFLADYTGVWEATYISGQGKRWRTHEEEWCEWLWFEVMEIYRETYPELFGTEGDLLDKYAEVPYYKIEEIIEEACCSVAQHNEITEPISLTAFRSVEVTGQDTGNSV